MVYFCEKKGTHSRYVDIKRIKDSSLFVNITSIGLVQLANYAIPILIIPYVVRVLGKDAFGAACYAQNIVAYLTLLVNFGFEYSATQEIAINKHDHVRIEQIFWRVIHAKALLFCITLFILGALYFILPRVNNDPTAFFYAGLINLGFTLFPTWFFQGMEKMARMSIFSFLVKLVGAVFTIIWVSSPNDTHIYLLSLSLAQVVVGFVSFCYVICKYHFKHIATPDLISSPEVKKGFPIFLNTFLVSCNLFVGVTIMGFYMTDDHIGIYSGAQRIIMAILMITSQPITISLFPRISRKFKESADAGIDYLKKSLGYVAAFSLLVSIVTFFAAPIMVSILLGEEFTASTELLRYMAILPLLVTLDSTITVQGLYGMQLQKYAPLVGLTTCTCNIVLNLIFVPRLGETGIILVWIICQIIDIVLAAMLIRNKYRNSKKF